MALASTILKQATTYVNSKPGTATGITGITSYVIDSPLDGQQVLSDGGDSDNLILIGGNNSLFYDVKPGVGASADHIVLTGNNDIVDATGNNVIDAYGSNAKITVRTLAGAPVNGGDNTVNVLQAGAPTTITPGGWSATVVGFSTGSIYVNAGEAYNLKAVGGPAVLDFTGSQVVNGDGTHSANNTAIAGDQAATLRGSNFGTNTLIVGANATTDDLMVSGEYARTTMDARGSTGHQAMIGFISPWAPSGDANDPKPYTLMYAGSGADNMLAGAGTTIMFSGLGPTTFGINYDPASQVPAHNLDLIENFKVGVDKLVLGGPDSTASIFAASTKNAQGGMQFHMTDGTTVDTYKTMLTASDILRRF